MKFACNTLCMCSYQWFCHCDDDMYINIPQLSQYLLQHDPHKPYYIGKWPGRKRGGYMNVQVSDYVTTSCV